MKTHFWQSTRDAGNRPWRLARLRPTIPLVVLALVCGLTLSGELFLRGRVGGSAVVAAAEDLQLRPRCPIHKPTIYVDSGALRPGDQYGRAGAGVRQHFHRAVVEDSQARVHLSERPRMRTCSAVGPGLGNYLDFYCCERFHQSLGYRTPWDVHKEVLLKKEQRQREKN